MMTAYRPSPPKQRTLWSELKAYADSRGSTFLAAVVIIAGQAWLARSLQLRPVWLFPAVAAALLIASVAVYRSDREEPSIGMRWFARAVVAMLALANALCLFLLVQNVFTKSTLSPIGLLLAGVVLWVVNIAVFALAYWEIDGGGPEDRARARAEGLEAELLGLPVCLGHGRDCILPYGRYAVLKTGQAPHGVR